MFLELFLSAGPRFSRVKDSLFRSVRPLVIRSNPSERWHGLGRGGGIKDSDNGGSVSFYNTGNVSVAQNWPMQNAEA